MSALNTVIVPIHPAGYPFIFAFAILTFLLSLISSDLGWIGFFLTAWCIYFFRDPYRIVPQDPDLILSPADGTVLKIEKAHAPKELEMGDEKLLKISIFLNVFDVHVNRVPCAGKIIKKVYHPGKFFNASLDKASLDNERMSIKLKHENGMEVGFVQIAGLVARRIICTINEHDYVEAGDKYGIIRFGSRADIYLPARLEAHVVEGQKMIGGESILASFSGDQKSLKGNRK